MASPHRVTQALLLGAVAAGAAAAVVAYLRSGAATRAPAALTAAAASAPTAGAAPPRPRRAVAVLTDNGSTKPASYLSLVRMADGVAARLGPGAPPVIPASARFAERVPVGELPPGTRPPASLEPTLRALAGEGFTDFLVLPGFVGPSSTYTSFVPEVFARVAGAHPAGALTLTTTRPVVDVEGDPGDDTVARIVVRHAAATAAARGFPSYALAVCDHGSPNPALAAARNAVAAQVAALTAGDPAVTAVAACSMERREGPAFDFNEPLLEGLLGAGGPPAFSGGGPVVVGLLFLSPGQHAGPGGDIAGIIAAAQAAAAREGRPPPVAAMTPLLGEAPEWVDLLAARAREGLAAMRAAGRL